MGRLLLPRRRRCMRVNCVMYTAPLQLGSPVPEKQRSTQLTGPETTIRCHSWEGLRQISKWGRWNSIWLPSRSSTTSFIFVLRLSSQVNVSARLTVSFRMAVYLFVFFSAMLCTLWHDNINSSGGEGIEGHCIKNTALVFSFLPLPISYSLTSLKAPGGRKRQTHLKNIPNRGQS